MNVSVVATDAADPAGDPGQVSSVSYSLVGNSESGTATLASDGSYSFSINTSGITGEITLQVTATDWNKNSADATIKLEPPKALTAFKFEAATNSVLTSDAAGTISGTNITVGVPTGTDISALVATFQTTGTSVSVNGVKQTSGQTANDFTSPVTYVVAANDGSEQNYTVTVGGMVGQPVFNPAGSTLSDVTNVSISATPSDATIRYTTDGTTPTTTTGTVYTGPFQVNLNSTIKAIAYRSGWVASTVGQATYSFVPGNLDSSFGSSSGVRTDFGNDERIYGMAIQPDGKIVAVGTTLNGSVGDFAIARYNADGSLDTSFGTSGKITRDFFGDDDEAYGVAIQSDGKIVVVGYATQSGYSDFAVVRYTSAGQLDTTFNAGGATPGQVITDFNGLDDYAAAVAIQSTGEIVVAGTADNSTSGYDVAVARYTSAGVLDTSFDSDGKVTYDSGSNLEDHGYAVSILSSGNILVAGDWSNSTSGEDFGVLRLTSAGALDSTFGSSGVAAIDVSGSNGIDWANAMTVQSDGKIVLAGYDYDYAHSAFGLARFNADGTPDSGFGGGGSLTTYIGTYDDHGNAVALQSDGKIVMVGASTDDSSGNTYDASLVRYNTDGSLDTTFGTGGKVRNSLGGSVAVGFCVAITQNGKILVVGDSDSSGTLDFALSRYFP